MIQTLQMVDAAISRIQSSLPATAKIETHRMDFSSFPIIGYSLTSDRTPQIETVGTALTRPFMLPKPPPAP